MEIKINRAEVIVERYGFEALYLKFLRWSVLGERETQWTWGDFFEVRADRVAGKVRGFELWAGPVHVRADNGLTHLEQLAAWRPE